MGFVTLRCPACGANIELQDDREFGFCTYCGTKVMQEKIVIEHRGAVKVEGTVTADSLLDRANIFLSDGRFFDADAYYNKVLDIEPRNAEAYWGKLCCKLKCRSSELLRQFPYTIENEPECRHALEFADEKTRLEYDAIISEIRDNQANRCYKAYELSKKSIKNKRMIAAIIAGVISLLAGVIALIVTNDPFDFVPMFLTGFLTTIPINLFIISLNSKPEKMIVKQYEKTKLFIVPVEQSSPSRTESRDKKVRAILYFTAIVIIDIFVLSIGISSILSE